MQLKPLDEIPKLSGTPEAQLEQIRNYLYQLREKLEENLRIIGNGTLTDEELKAIRKLIG